MELKDTVSLMQSADYKERFKAEYYQLVGNPVQEVESHVGRLGSG